MKLLIVNDAVPNYVQFHAESVNAAELPAGEFLLKNSSFLARGVAYGDRVAAVRTESGGWQFDRVLQPGGFSSFRVYSRDLSSAVPFKAACRAVDALGAGSSLMDEDRLALVTVPPDVDYAAVQEAFRHQMVGIQCVYTSMAVRHMRQQFGAKRT